MVVISNSVVIRCTPEQAFDYLSDLRSETRVESNLRADGKGDGRAGWAGYPVSRQVEAQPCGGSGDSGIRAAEVLDGTQWRTPGGQHDRPVRTCDGRDQAFRRLRCPTA